MEPQEIRDELADLDPIRESALKGFSSRPIVGDLLRAIVNEPLDAREAPVRTVPARAPTPLERVDGAGRRRARRQTALVVVSAAAALVIGLVLGDMSWRTVPAGQHRTSPSVGRPLTTGPVGSAPTTGTWTLVSDPVATSFHSVPSPGDTPTFWLSCPGPMSCYALVPVAASVGANGFLVRAASDEVMATSDGGHSWRRSVLPGTLNTPTRIVCVDTSTCALLGLDASGRATFVETTDGGGSWRSVPGPAGLASDPIADLACATASSCMAVAVGGFDPGSGIAFVTTDAGSTWSEFPLPSGFTGVPMGTSVQCLTAETCLVSGVVGLANERIVRPGSGSVPTAHGEVLRTTDGGRSWTVVASSQVTGGPSALSCTGSADCMAVFGDGLSFFVDRPARSIVLASTDGGRTWSQVVATGVPRGLMMALSCQSSELCWISGDPGPSANGSTSGYIGSTSDTGRTWQRAVLPPDVEFLLTISCSEDSACFALGLQGHGGGSLSLVFLSNR